MATGKSFLRQILLSVFLLQTVLVLFEGKYIDKILGSFEYNIRYAADTCFLMGGDYMYLILYYSQ